MVTVNVIFMFDGFDFIGSQGDHARRSMASADAGDPALAAVIGLLSGVDGEAREGRELVDDLDLLEQITSAAAAAKVQVTAALREARAVTDAEAGLRPSKCGRAVPHEVGLARRESPARARVHVQMATALTTDMPETLAALRRGEINEARAEIMVVETADLSREDRRTLDALLGPALAGKGDREIRHDVRRAVCDIDSEGAELRARRARARRHVTSRDLGDGMMRVSGVLPAEEAVSAVASLNDYAKAWQQMGDQRTRDQLMADAFAERLVGSPFGQGSVDDQRKKRSVEIQLVMSSEMLFGDDDTTPAHLRGYGPLPLGLARAILADADGKLAIRRLYAMPDKNTLVAMDSHSIKFPVGLRRLLFARDGETCRTPFCNAPIRHADHVKPRAKGGSTDLDGGQGLCAACNYAKEWAGWRHHVRSRWPERHTVSITTPTGHTHHTLAPPLPMTPTRSGITGELYFCDIELEWAGPAAS